MDQSFISACTWAKGRARQILLYIWLSRAGAIWAEVAGHSFREEHDETLSDFYHEKAACKSFGRNAYVQLRFRSDTLVQTASSRNKVCSTPPIKKILHFNASPSYSRRNHRTLFAHVTGCFQRDGHDIYSAVLTAAVVLVSVYHIKGQRKWGFQQLRVIQRNCLID